MPTKTRNKPGPKPKVGDEQRTEILAVITDGGSIRDAAESVGVSVRTVRNAMRSDPKFFLGVKKARKTGKIKLIRRVNDAKCWQSAAWMLERMYGSEFGRKERHEHTGRNGGAIKTETTHVVDYDAIEGELRSLGSASPMARRAAPNN